MNLETAIRGSFGVIYKFRSPKMITMKQSKKKKDKPLYSQWYLRRGKSMRGPFTSITIRRLITQQKVMVSDEISQNKQDWRPVGLVPEVLPPNLRNKEGLGVDEIYDDYEGTPGNQALPYEEKRRFPIIPILVGLTMTVIIVGGVVLMDQGPDGKVADCLAKPAPDINWNNCHLPGIQAEEADLSRLQANNSDLQGAKLSSAILIDAQLQYSDLNNADLSYANLQNIQLKGSILRNADLSYANLSGADLRYTNLSGANLGSTKLDQAQLGQAVWINGQHCSADSIGACTVQSGQPIKPVR
jgi:hypothetical protein